MISLGSHPIQIAYDLADRYGMDLRLSFSEYYYRPQAALDERTAYAVPLAEVSPKWVEERISALRPGWELALNSRITDQRNRVMHIPMIDFSTAGIPDTDSIFFHEIVGREVAHDLSIFDSGRSFHGYSTTLLGKGDWTKLMGRLLLLNLPGKPAMVDSRWVGHRLLGGYSALRWSASSAYHEQMPRVVKRHA